MELLLLLLLPALFSGVFGSGDDEDQDAGGPDDGGNAEPDGQIWRGTSGPDLQEGTGVADLMLGGANTDELEGGLGDDLLAGQTASDMLFGGEGHDLVLGGWGDDSLFGGAGNDFMLGGAMDDRLDGGEDNDVLFGSSGADLMQGDAGNDYLVGLDVRADLPVEDLLVNFTVADPDGLESTVRGYFGAAVTDADLALLHQNILNADASASASDSLFGGEGNDFIEGDQGDSLTGGAGADTFAVYNEVGDEAVTITDFDPTTERLLVWSEARIDGTDVIDTPAGLEVRVDNRLVAVLQGVTSAMMADANAITYESEFVIKLN